jgi:hypothetical protein
MQAKGLLKEAPPETYTRVIDEWLFPLWSLELTRVIPVDKADLRSMQDEWLYQEMGVTNEY